MGQADHYYSRKGETLDLWIDAAATGGILIFPHLAENHDTVKKLAVQAIMDAGLFDRIEELPIYVPSEITPDTAISLANDIKRVYAEPTTSDQRVLRMPIFYITTNEEGGLPHSISTFCSVLYDKSRNDGNNVYSYLNKGNTVIFPIIDITTNNVLNKPAESVFRKLAGKPQKGRPPKRVKFDIRNFEPEYLLQLLQPEFQDEDLSKNPDFIELAETYKGESRLAFAVRNYRRKNTLAHFRNEEGGALTDNDFSTVYRFVRTLMLDMDVTVVPVVGRDSISRAD